MIHSEEFSSVTESDSREGENGVAQHDTVGVACEEVIVGQSRAL